MRENFADCLAQVLKNEGGYVDNPHDPGGATNRGITLATLRSWRKNKGQQRAVSKQDVRDLTVIEAGEIYRARYWDVIRGDLLPSGVDAVAMDGAVNSGSRQSAKWLQRALGVAADGRIGPVTIRAARQVSAADLILDILDQRLAFLKRLKNWPSFGRGWSRRLSDVEAHALQLSRRSPVADGLAGASGAAAGAGAAVNEGLAPIAPEIAPPEIVPTTPPDLTGVPPWLFWLALAAVTAWFIWNRRAVLAAAFRRASDRLIWARDAWSISSFEGDFIGLYREFHKATLKFGRKKSNV